MLGVQGRFGIQGVQRTGVLALVAGFIAWQGRTSAGPSVLSGLSAWPLAEGLGLIAAVLALALGAAEGWLLVQLLQQNGRLLARLEALEAHLGLGASGPVLGLPLGTPAPPFELPSLEGETLTLETLRAAGKPVLLLFTDPGCGTCTALLRDIGRWQCDHGATLTLALLSRGTPEANRAKVAKHKVTRVLVQQDREVAQAYQANGTPAAVLVQPDGTIGSPLARGAEAIPALVARTIIRPVPVTMGRPAAANGQGPATAPGLPAGPQIGDPAPRLFGGTEVSDEPGALRHPQPGPSTGWRNDAAARHALHRTTTPARMNSTVVTDGGSR